MKSAIYIALSFVGGSVLGGFLGYKYAKKKYETIADNEIASVKKVFENILKKETEVEKQTDKTSKKLTASKLEGFTPEDKQNYMDYSKQYRIGSDDNRIAGIPSTKLKKEESKNVVGPYVITPDEFNETDYETKTLLYFSDNFLTDEFYNVIEHPIEIVGPNALDQFGVYEDDAVYVCDESLGIVYLVLLDERNYKKIAPKIKPKSKLQTGSAIDDD